MITVKRGTPQTIKNKGCDQRKKGRKFMENKRVTKAMRYADIIAMLNGENPANGTDTATAIEFLNEQIAQVNKKNSASSSKPSKEDIEKDRLRSLLYDYMREHGRVTCSEMLKNIPDFYEFNVNKVTGLLRNPVLDGIVKKEKVKNTMYYFMA